MATHDRRNSSRSYPVWEYSITQMSWDNTGHEEQTETVGINGIITEIVWTIGDGGAQDPDVVFKIEDKDGNTLFTTTEDDNQTVTDYAGGDFAMYQLTGIGFIVSADPNKAPTTSLTVDVTLRGV